MIGCTKHALWAVGAALLLVGTIAGQNPAAAAGAQGEAGMRGTGLPLPLGARDSLELIVDQ